MKSKLEDLEILLKCKEDEIRNMKLLSILKDKLHFHSGDNVKDVSNDVKPYHIVKIGKGCYTKDE